MNHQEAERTEATAAALRARLPWTPEILAVLGSGLGALADAVEAPISIPFHDLPGLPAAGVGGHQGRFVAGMLEGRRVLIQAGRYHFYEGHPAGVVLAPVRAAALLGVPTLLVTNAAGGVNPDFGPGTLMLIRDHLNLMGQNPLVGPGAPGEPRFPDMSVAYDSDLRALAQRTAEQLGIPLEEGVYAAVSGPSYETPAEVRMIGLMGGDAVGMSTVPEVIVARARGMRVLGISLITNPGAGISSRPLSHQEVLEAGEEAAPRFQRLTRGILAAPDPTWGTREPGVVSP
ncbi:MAG: purine-nucleoside phosphorylase [Gemmatimonadales bacterium]|nr:MAG: purine-nucleoside phosphorylase [Gemmatimonadales bacterium]